MNTYSETVTWRQYCDVIWIRFRYAPKYENPVLCSTSVTSLIPLQRHRCGLIALPSSWNDDVFDCNSWVFRRPSNSFNPHPRLELRNRNFSLRTRNPSKDQYNLKQKRNFHQRLKCSSTDGITIGRYLWSSYWVDCSTLMRKKENRCN